MMITINFIEPIKINVKRNIIKLVKRLNEVIEFKHSILLIITPSYVVKESKSITGYGFGVFDYQNKKKLKIWLSGEKLPDLRFKDWLEMQSLSLCHEVAHYEQFRDGKKMQERGVNVRTKTILKLCSKEYL